jgi:pimeloyl-ACP methyl ester carboxylesterase
MNSQSLASWVGESPENASGFILIAHGLNLKPSRMLPLAQTLCHASEGQTPRGLACRILVLQGHEEDSPSQMRQVSAQSWKNTILAEIRALQAIAGERPIHFLGFSLGALVGAWGLQQFEESPFQKMALIAPPLETRGYVRLAALIPGPGSWTLPSKNHPEYRANDRTSLAAYRALFEIQDEVRSGNPLRLNIDTRVWVSPKDELVSAKKLAKKAASAGWTQWSIQNVGSIEPTLRPTYHHLLIDEASMGHEAWQEMQRALEKHFGI